MPLPIVTKSRGPRSTPVTPERILDAAQAVFAQHGFNGSSIRAIAKSAGCDPKLIYYHFSDKDAVLLGLLQRSFTPLLTQVQAIFKKSGLPERAPAPDPACKKNSRNPSRQGAAYYAATLWQVLNIMHTHLVENTGMRQMIRGEMASGSEHTRDTIAGALRPMLQLLFALFQRGIETKILRPDLNPRLAAFFFARMTLEIMDLMPAASTRVLNLPPGQAIILAEKEWFQVFWRGIAANPNELKVPHEMD